jgi:hypothetical protein
MIAFGSSITDPDVYERCAGHGIRLASEPGSELLARPAAGSIFRSYNLILDDAAELEDLEALVLLHQDAEIVDSDFCGKVRRCLRDPEVGVVGCVGAIGVRSIAWWEGSVTWASFVHRYGKLESEEFPSLSWHNDSLPPYARTGEVDTVDGFVLALSPWVVQNVRFDESLGQLLHGYDFDFCLQVREQGRKIVTEDLKVVHHHSLELASDLETWIQAHMKVAEKWDGRMPKVGVAGGDWKQRARRAEAEAAAARAQAITTQLQIDARARQHARELHELTESTSWRLTAPFRRLRAVARRSAQRRRRVSTS